MRALLLIAGGGAQSGNPKCWEGDFNFASCCDERVRGGGRGRVADLPRHLTRSLKRQRLVTIPWSKGDLKFHS